MASAAFRITYQRYADLREDVAQMGHGGLMVKGIDATGLELDAAVSLELVLPDGTSLTAAVQVIHVFPGVGVAVSITPPLLEQARRLVTGKDAGVNPARHERVDGQPRTPAAAAAPESLSQAEKIQLALHGNRDQRNAILRDPNRMLHPFVLKNPQINSDDVLAIAKNAQMSPELLKSIADRKEWFQRPQIAIALVRNPKTPPDVAVRALDHVSLDALRQLAKGGALPHVVQAARKKVLR